jgi:hypothetical protein
MKVSIATQVSEESTAVFTVSFKDEDDQPSVPNSLTWKLTDGSGNVINSRTAVTASPASAVNIVLKGDDLALSAGVTGNAEKRFLTVYGTYDSSYGSGLPYKHEVGFPIANLIAIP